MPAAEARPVDSVLPTVARLRYDAALMRRIDELHLRYPFAGARMLRGYAGRRGPLYNLLQISSGRIARLLDARPIACTVTTSLHVPRPRRLILPGATYDTYELTNSAQRSGGISLGHNLYITS